MDTSTHNKWQIRLATAIIFVLGFSAGALAFNAYQRWARFGGRTGGDHFEQMLDRLQLNADQKTQVHQILDDARSQLRDLRKQTEPRFNEIRQQTDDRLQKVLSPEQWQQFQQERERMRGRGRRGAHGPPSDER